MAADGQREKDYYDLLVLRKGEAKKFHSFWLVCSFPFFREFKLEYTLSLCQVALVWFILRPTQT